MSRLANDQAAMAEVAWVAREARALVAENVSQDSERWRAFAARKQALLEYIERPTPIPPTKVRCIARRCCDQTLSLPTWAAVEAWMDEHVREVGHDGRWPVTFTIWHGGDMERQPSVSYRDAKKTLAGP